MAREAAYGGGVEKETPPWKIGGDISHLEKLGAQDERAGIV